jgi:hypothetical protein
MYYDGILKTANNISPQKYNPKTDFVANSRFKNIGISLGYGTKTWESVIIKSSTPGIGTYNIPSIFDKGRRYKVPLN